MTRSPLRRLFAGAGAAVAAPALAVLLTAAPAGAALSGVTVSDVTPVDDQTITVSGTASPGATLSIAQCNVDVPVDGTDCNRTATNRFARVTANAVTGAFSVNIVVDDTFTNASFIPGVPPSGSSTACDASAGSDQCAVLVVEYASNVPVDQATVNVTF